MIAAYAPSLAQLAGLGAVLLVTAALLGWGMLTRAEHPEEWLVRGWGISTLVTTLAGTATPVGFTALAAATLVPGLLIAGLNARHCRESLVKLGQAMTLSLPLLLVLAGAQASQWDEFSNWLPKLQYLYEFNGFPRASQPPSLSALPAYPYGLATIGYFASRIAGALVENSITLFNVLLHVSAGLMISRIIMEGSGSMSAKLPWTLIALGLVATTAGNPAFVPKLVFTAYADGPSAVVLAMAAVSLWRCLEATVADNHDAARRHAVTAGLAFAVLLNLKQANLLLVALTLAGAGLAALRTAMAHAVRLLRLAPYLIVPAAVTYLAWRLHVSAHIAGGEFSFQPLRNWLWDDTGAIALRMLLIASKKGGYFSLMLVLVGAACYALRRSPGPFGRLAIIAATVFVGYNAFLYVAYVGAFGDYEGRNAASYWRYNTQLGILGVSVACYGMGILWQRHSDSAWVRRLASRKASLVMLMLVVVAPIVQAPRIRFDINPAKAFVRSVGKDIAALIPAGSRLAVIDRLDNGFWTLLIRYEVGRQAIVNGLYGPNAADAETIRSAIDGRLDATHAWVHVPEPMVESALQVALPARQSHLMVRRESSWEVQRSWAWPSYDDPHRFND